MSLPILIVDAFTGKPFAGNPAAVCLLEGPADEDWMQQVAAEMNLSETAFVVRRDEFFDLRWFTPRVEVDLCGHATLASAHVLWEERRVEPDQPIRFQTRSGILTCTRAGEWIEMDFPREAEHPTQPPSGLVQALGTKPVYLGQSRFDYLVELPSEEAVRQLEPDFRLLAQVPSRGVIVTARSDAPEFDFVSRFFAPAAGIDEDPVTGSAHCCLGPFWSSRLGRSELVGWQASNRGGLVRVRTANDRVVLCGQAVTTLRGSLADHATSPS
ncbi:MAG: PhzF family phenazine biosynthesis protein [Planctomycetes bacterium]|nr:PhzF family phenazine biosynthesis protein [Planctomycetota bacterium]